MKSLQAFRAFGAAFALVCLGFVFAHAVTGTAPVCPGPPCFQLIDGAYVQGLSSGQNYSFQSGIAAAGTTQATATQLTAGISLYEVDTASGSATGIALPPCVAGTQFTIYNATGTNITLFPQIANNALTGAQDTINATTSLTVNSHTATSPACAKNGVWGAS